MWDPPGPGIEPVSPALAGRLLTTGPPGKPSQPHLIRMFNHSFTERFFDSYTPQSTVFFLFIGCTFSFFFSAFFPPNIVIILKSHHFSLSLSPHCWIAHCSPSYYSISSSPMSLFSNFPLPAHFLICSQSDHVNMEIRMHATSMLKTHHHLY